MNKFLTFVAALVAVASAAGVVELTDENFDQIIKDNKYVLVKFYAPWCGHCKKLAPEFEKAAEALDGKAVLADLDATEHKEAAEKFAVRGYPTLFWFIDGEKVEYDGGRTADTIIEWVGDMTGPAINVVDTLPEIGGKPQVVLAAAEMDADFDHLASKKRSDFAFYHLKADGEATASIQHKGEAASSTTEITAEGLETLLKENAMPLFGQLDGESYGKYMSSGQGLVWSLFEMESSDDMEKVASDNREMMTAVANAFKGKYSIAYTDTIQFKSALEGMLGVTEFPTIAVNKKAGDKMKYLYTGEMTSEKIIAFMNGVDDGSVQATMKSEPVPTTQEEAVQVVVGDTLEKDVFHAEKDVLFEVYAPWCGHCKKLAPEFEKVAKKVLKEGLDDLVTIAKMDGTANDSPVESITWDGFPTLYYVKAGSSEPLKYDGPRDAKGIWKWIKKNHSKADEIKDRIAASKETPVDEEKEEL